MFNVNIILIPLMSRFCNLLTEEYNVILNQKKIRLLLSALRYPSIIWLTTAEITRHEFETLGRSCSPQRKNKTEDDGNLQERNVT